MASPATNALVSTRGGSDEEGRKGEEGTREGAKSVVAGSSGSRGSEDKDGRDDEEAVKGSPVDKLPDEIPQAGPRLFPSAA
ncbi:hypothetical protein JCM8547_002830 [Rhodosporidiobolus lusitaniae]